MNYRIYRKAVALQLQNELFRVVCIPFDKNS